jgi:hypothetical protein
MLYKPTAVFIEEARLIRPYLDVTDVLLVRVPDHDIYMEMCEALTEECYLVQYEEGCLLSFIILNRFREGRQMV